MGQLGDNHPKKIALRDNFGDNFKAHLFVN